MKILVIGGNRFFGKRLISKLLEAQHDVTLLNRGNLSDGFGSKVKRITCDRKNETEMRKALDNESWDIVYDQVCFNAIDSKAATEIFKDRVKHYIFTSSLSVFDPGVNLSEDDFDPYSYKYKDVADEKTQYAEAKRQCEAVFFQNQSFDVTAVRFPFVLGTDDYTGRLKFHIDHINQEKPIYFPNINARVSLISSDDAANVLEFLSTQKPQGPLHAASVEPISLKDFVKEIEKITKKTALFLDKESREHHSPYGIQSDWFMSIKKLTSLGFSPKPIESWLRKEIEMILKSQLT